MRKNQFEIEEERTIPYYEETQKRTFLQKMKKIRNTLLMYLTYFFPTNKARITMHRWRGVNIGQNVYIGLFCFFDNLYPEYIYIEDNVSINAGTMILTHFNPMKRHAAILEAKVSPVYIKEGAVIAVRSTILPGVTIGKSSIVSAGTIVEKSVKDFTIVKGNPAKEVMDIEILLNKE